MTPFKWSNCDKCKMLGTIYHRMTFSTFMNICMQEYIFTLMHIDVTVWAALTMTCVFHLVEFVIIYSYNNKLPVSSILKLVLEDVAFFSTSVLYILF